MQTVLMNLQVIINKSNIMSRYKTGTWIPWSKDRITDFMKNTSFAWHWQTGNWEDTLRNALSWSFLTNEKFMTHTQTHDLHNTSQDVGEVWEVCFVSRITMTLFWQQTAVQHIGISYNKRTEVLTYELLKTHILLLHILQSEFISYKQEQKIAVTEGMHKSVL
jgi:hypothetical protein